MSFVPYRVHVSTLRTAARRVLNGVERMVGRRNMARAARFFWLEVRLDGPNTIEFNGEQLVQSSLNGAAGPIEVLDVGAHFGEWSTSLLNQVPRDDLHVTCFEPSTYTFERLSAHFVDHRRAPRLEGIALGNREGTAVLRIVHNGAGSNSLVTFVAERALQQEEEVAISTVDAYCASQGLQNVALLKIDAEGADLDVMKGAAEMLAQQRIGLLQFEYNHRWIHARGYLKDAFDLLQPHGYSLGKVTARGIEEYPAWHEELETFRESNYLAYLPSWRERLPVFPWWNA
jgi:FkbM family methyltransferase